MTPAAAPSPDRSTRLLPTRAARPSPLSAAAGETRRTEQRNPMSGNSSDPPAERLAYSVDEAARITGLSRDLLYDQMRTGQLAYLKVGRRRIITRQQLEAFLTRGAA